MGSTSIKSYITGDIMPFSEQLQEIRNIIIPYNSIIDNVGRYDEMVNEVMVIFNDGCKNENQISKQQDSLFESDGFEIYATKLIFDHVIASLKNDGALSFYEDGSVFTKDQVDTVLSTTISKWTTAGVNIAGLVDDKMLSKFIDDKYLMTVDYLLHVNGYENRLLEDTGKDLLSSLAHGGIDYSFIHCLGETKDVPSYQYDLEGKIANSESRASIPAAEAYILMHPAMRLYNLSLIYNDINKEDATGFDTSVDYVKKETAKRTAVMSYIANKIKDKTGNEIDLHSNNSLLRFKNGELANANPAAAFIKYSTELDTMHNYPYAILTMIDIDPTLMKETHDYHFVDKTPQERRVSIHGSICSVLIEAGKADEEANKIDGLVPRCGMLDVKKQRDEFQDMTDKFCRDSVFSSIIEENNEVKSPPKPSQKRF